MQTTLKQIKVYDLYAFLSIALFVVIGHYYRVDSLRASIVWPAAGLSVGFAYFYGKRIIPSIFLGLFVGYSLSQWIIVKDTFFINTIQPLVLSLSVLVGVYLTIVLRKKFKLYGDFTFCRLFLIFLIALIVSAVNAVLASSSLVLLSTLDASYYPLSIIVWFLGDVFGILIVGIALVTSLSFDEDPYFKRISVIEVVIILAFILFTLLLLHPSVEFISFLTHKYLYIPLAILIPFYFPVRLHLVFIALFLVIMGIYPPYSSHDAYFTYMFDVNLFLLLMTTIVITLTLFLLSMTKRNQDLKVKNTRLKQLLESLESLLTLNEGFSLTDDRSDHAHAKDLFHLVFKLFDKIDYGSLILVKEGKVNYIDCVGFDIESLNALSFTIDDWKLELKVPYLQRHMERFLKKELKENYPAYHEKNPALKESVMMSVVLSKEHACEMSFDIDETSSESFNQADMMYFESLNILLNSFYESQTLSLQTNRLRNQIVIGLLKTMSLYDEGTVSHSKDVAFISQAIAAKLNLSRELVNDCYWAGIVHDIGKIGVAESVLQKHGTLTLTEFEIMKAHVDFGYQVLKDSPSLEHIAQMVKEHHERYDGSGYPLGLKGDDIPLTSAVLHLAECVATMVKTQTYQDKKTKDEVINEVATLKGVHFHPRVVHAFMDCVKDGVLEDYYK